jgi:hypothetical protein
MQRPQRYLTALLALPLCAAVWCTPQTVRAADPAAEPAATNLAPLTLEAALTDLDSPNPAVRDRATTDLMIRDGFGSDDLSKAMRETKTPERRLRLIRVATHRFFAAIPARSAAPDHDSGSLGVNLSDVDPTNRIVRPYQCPILQTPAVLITGTLPGFPAYAYLRPGDLVTAIDGQVFPDDIDQDKFVERIKGFAPGQVMTLDLLRDGVKMRVRIKLDSKQRLTEIHSAVARPPELSVDLQKHLQTLIEQGQPAATIQLDFPPPPSGTPTAVAPQGVIQLAPGGAIIRGNVIFRPGNGPVQILPDGRVRKKVGN